ncbi:SET domain-containing protein SmydA-8 isoform X2 [Stomoxys calcitrans]|uniref:SET domain-containing protein SmydA-8 isoform X2 n=1 Tax=Stomoxys calcitrans TaxID=35570 RepID=UPI0027E365AC|nr:SET domain-containing protein SmydA-8 isoform X2 [Stomoxys calcitrans]
MFKSRIEVDQKYGRSLVTTEPVAKGEIVVDELPFAHGPKQNSDIVCLGCYMPLQFDEDGDSMDRCETCDWPLCSSCIESPVHKDECKIFAEANVRFAGNVGEDGVCAQLDCITPLRVLLAKEADPERWEKEVAPMEYHDKERRENSELWNADLVNIAQYLRGPCKLGDRFSEDLIMQVVGILEVNAFEGRTLQGYAFRALYPVTGILSHNCVPNTMRSIYPSEDYRIRLRAMVDLESGQQLQHSYSYTLYGTAQRQEHLKAGKYFTCDCKRCKDPAELGTNFSTFKCSKCEDGWLLCQDPLDASTEWKCTLCEFKTSNEAVQKATSVMQAEVAQVQSMDMSGERLQETERLLKKYRSVLHPLHFIQISLKQNLVEMYGRVAGYEMVELPDVLLERKEEICRHVLRVLNVFEPGLSRTKATILYELHVPVVLLAKSGFIAGVLAGAKLKEKLEEAIAILRECVNILKYEDQQSHEGVLGLVAKQAMEQLMQSVEGLDGA